MTDGFLLGLGVGVATAWFFYWRVVKFAAKVGFTKQDVWRDVFSRATYSGLVEMREALDLELARRERPTNG